MLPSYLATASSTWDTVCTRDIPYFVPHPPMRRKVGFKIGSWAAHRLPSGMLCVSPSLSPCLLQSFSKHVLKLQFRLWHTILRVCMVIAVYNALNFLQYTILQLWTYYLSLRVNVRLTVTLFWYKPPFLCNEHCPWKILVSIRITWFT